jgi:hypothetical protein
MNERHGTDDIFRPQRTGAVGLATLRLDGFVGLSANHLPGTVTTKPFQLVGNQLQLNLDARGGQAIVELLDETGQPLPGFSGSNAVALNDVDDLRVRPTWSSGSLSSLAGRVVQVRVRLTNATLYSLQVVNSTQI